ncbi:type II toxin-antitoxin system RelE/ParE family toxin [Methylosinus sp. PW1]|uniref:type II toxin-antitoxin system RelE/ParE family toxin n=1 Tax=Methylosinus sp. PW1 TaxID=107636 RepID=UPI00055B52DA|nr:type II toxin-antitoxin system RelE/ParE family toxin [Methylosinus sp. PW1]
MKVLWTRPALRDLEQIGDYVSRDNPAAAAKLIARICERVDALAQQPSLGRPGRVPQTRELVIAGTPFLAPYRVRAEVVEILAIFHGARLWPGEFEPGPEPSDDKDPTE